MDVDGPQDDARPLVRVARRSWTHVTGRSVARWTGVTLVTLLVCGLWGVATASAQASLGPHHARYEVTLDGSVTVDLGPLGTLVIDSPLPAALGARVVVQEIPREVTALEGGSTLDAVGRDLERYVQFFSAPDATLDVAVRALVTDAVRRTVIATLGVLGTVVLVRLLLGPARRRELGDALRPHRVRVAGTTALLVAVAGTLTASGEGGASSDTTRSASAVFDGTPLEGARITGRLAGLIDTYGGYVVDAYRDNEQFYGAVVANLEDAWAVREEGDAAVARAREAALRRTTSPSPSLEPGETDQVEADAGVVEDGETPEPVTLLVISDLHCNVGMAPVIRTAALLAEADVVLNAGDTTVNGTAVESYCVSALIGAAPDGTAVVVADGNHDSGETSEQERALGAVVLDGAVVEVEGIRILGDSDPRATRIGSGTTLVGDETVAEAGERLAEIACAQEQPVDLLLVHDPAMGDEVLEQGCAPAQVSGHMHRRVGPHRFGAGVRFTSSSTAGASLGMPTVGPLQGVAELTVLRFDPETRSLLDYRLVRVHPDARVTVGFPVRWPNGPLEPQPVPGIR